MTTRKSKTKPATPAAAELPAATTAVAVIRKGPARTRAIAQHEKPAPAKVSMMAQSDTTTMFERLARDPNVDPEKLERMINMKERLEAADARKAFDAAFSEMQAEIPIVCKDNAVLHDGVAKYKFANDADITEIIRPILGKYGFSLRHRHETDPAKPHHVKVIGILAHRQGHREQDEFYTEADDSGKKNPIQSLGSARSYGKRYTTLALVNIATVDDDGAASHPRTDPERRQGSSSRSASRPPAQRAAPAATNHAGDRRLVTDKQLKRLYAITKTADRKGLVVKQWLLTRYGLQTSKQITREWYDEICTMIATKGPLDMTPVKQAPAARRDPGPYSDPNEHEQPEEQGPGAGDREPGDEG